VAPDAVTTVELPEQIVGLFTVNIGKLLTVTNTVVVPEHTPVAPVIVYVVLTVGVAVTVAPFDELNVADGLHV
jgi:hypothetical protein